ncbi:hypothetical protein M407DRAFT_35082 [Tulasnella calospora MUT 4182]|uniref:Uncharacterized protein n=1 Tax=Tulasnella calospora MUT 4182 TaxID=1051891 RepID=A0A0C3PZN0_9AGAM|nr:hypothetical protein M407DRAFT_35082 [Tulasnella calospora MUT 4182]
MVGGGGLWGQLASLAPQPPPPTVEGGRGWRPASPAPQAPPPICLTCTSTPRKNYDAQTDPNDGPKATATAAVQTEGSSAINDESSPQNIFEPFKLSYTCGCVVHMTNPPWICPTCGGGVFDVHSFDNSSLLTNSGSKEPPLSQTSSSGQEQQTPTNPEPKVDEDDDSRIVSVYFG